jgi:hypothetical protein
VKVGDLIKFKKTGKVAVYLGQFCLLHSFWSHEFGRVDLKLPIAATEVISESR